MRELQRLGRQQAIHVLGRKDNLAHVGGKAINVPDLSNISTSAIL